MSSPPDSTDESQPVPRRRPAAARPLGEAAASPVPANGTVPPREPERPEPAVEEDARAAAYLRGPTAFCA